MGALSDGLPALSQKVQVQRWRRASSLRRRPVAFQQLATSTGAGRCDLVLALRGRAAPLMPSSSAHVRYCCCETHSAELSALSPRHRTAAWHPQRADDRSEMALGHLREAEPSAPKLPLHTMLHDILRCAGVVATVDTLSL